MKTGYQTADRGKKAGCEPDHQSVQGEHPHQADDFDGDQGKGKGAKAARGRGDAEP
jgi:hypothetical protein